MTGFQPLRLSCMHRWCPPVFTRLPHRASQSELQYGYATRPNNRRGVLYGYVPFSTGGTDGLAVSAACGAGGLTGSS